MRLATRPTATVWLLLPLLAACSAAPEAQVPSPVPPTATQLPTPAPTPKPVPSTVRLWASPALPAALFGPAQRVAQVGNLQVEWVEDPTQAEVRIEPSPDRPLTRWIYAVVAPFPTIEDQISLEELRRAWTSAESEIALYLTDRVANELATLLGSEAKLQLASGERILDQVWEARNAYAIIPFEKLEPRWKVIRLDNRSPLDRDFDSQSYPLVVSFGLSGDPELMDLLDPLLDWPHSNRDPDKMTTVLMTGVSALVRATAWRMDRYGADYPGQQIGAIMRQADITHISHESAFTEDCPPPDPVQTSLRFCSAPRHLPLFEAVGVDLIELSGNHLADWGTEALLSTLDLYDQQGFETFAGGRDLAEARLPALIEHNGNRIAFLGCNEPGPAYVWAKADRPGALRCDDDGLMERVTQLADDGYSVIFTFQWRESASTSPLPDQIDAFRRAIEAGAVIVSGSQAHRPQSMEFYAGGLIHYGLGNLFFDQMYKLSLRQEFLDRHTFYDGRYINTELVTAMLEDFAQPRPMTEVERAALLGEIFAASGW
ncbi:MAG: CapA family protein [Anaerolineales bacterium]|nr:CapA family protein [Anaerolineales bacterium]